jgi:hypothetical protein
MTTMVMNHTIAFLISRLGILCEMLRFLPAYPLLSWYGVQACPVMSNERYHHVMFSYTLVTPPDLHICLRPDSRTTEEKAFNRRRLDQQLRAQGYSWLQALHRLTKCHKQFCTYKYTLHPLCSISSMNELTTDTFAIVLLKVFQCSMM